MIVTHYLRRDYTDTSVLLWMAVGKHFFLLYEPNEFRDCWRLVEFKIIRQWHVRRGEWDRMFVVVAAWEFDDDPRVA